MSAEGQLYNPALFARAGTSVNTDVERLVSETKRTFDTGLHLPHADLALEYLEIVQGLKTPTSLSAVKGHLFRLLRPALARETDLRDELSKIRGPRSVERYVEVVREMKERMDRDAKEAEGRPTEELIRLEPTTGLNILPHWLAQPYFRISSLTTRNTLETETKRVHGLDTGHESDDRDGDEKRKQEGIKRAKLMAVSQVAIPLAS